MGGVATSDKKGSHFQRFGLKIFVIAAKAAKAATLKIANDLPIFASYYVFVIVSLT